MLANITDVITGIIDAFGSFLTPTASEGGLVASEVTAIAIFFAVPITIGVVKRVRGLIKSSK